MTSAGGWVPEPLFGDALAGSGGMGEPLQPNLFVTNRRLDVFPDALSGVLAPDASYGAAAPLAAVLPVPTAAQRPAAPRTQPARSRTPPPPRPWSQLPPPNWAPPPRPSVQLPPPGRQPPPPGRASALPTVVPLSRNPTVDYVPMPGSPPANVSLVRPPAYLPQSVGIAQIRAAMQQARRTTTDKSKATATAARRKGSGVWGVLFALLIVLVVTGAAGKIITAISHLLQGS